jgi:uncharacterized protein
MRESDDRRVQFDFEIDFTNGGGIQGQGFRLDIGGDDIPDRELADYIVSDLRLLMVGDVRILNKQIIRERHKRAPEAAADARSASPVRATGFSPSQKPHKKGANMLPRIDVITLAVSDLDRSVRFYREGLGLNSSGVIGTEFKGDEVHPAGAVAMFDLVGGLILALYPRSELAKDANLPLGSTNGGEFSIGHAVPSEAEVDALLARAQAAGARLTDQPHDRPWGIYSGYFRDPDGHLWEIMWNPQLRTPTT